MRFSDILGQDHAVDQLRSALRTGRVHHAYLFVGPAGTGRHDTAWAFAQALQCERPQEDACGSCLPCVKSSRRVHPDIRWVEPTEARASIGIDQVRAIRSEVAYGPYEGKYTVYVLTPADRIPPEAQNALLKLLEEPPPRTVIVLVAESPHALLPTVTSRVQPVRFRLVPADAIEHILRTRLGIEPARARVLAALCGGRAALAVRWAGSPDALRDRDRVVAWLGRVEQEGLLAAQEAANEFAGERDRLPDLLDLALLWYRDLLVWQQTASSRLLVNLDRLDEIQRLAPTLSADALRRRVEAIQWAKADLRRNVHPRLVLDTMFLRFN